MASVDLNYMKIEVLKIFGMMWFVMLSSTLSAQTYDLPPNREPGHCYAKCMIADWSEELVIAIPVYLGSDSLIIDRFVKDTSFIINEGASTWVKKKADRDCHPSAPNDCLVWSLVEQEPEEVIINRYLTDTSDTDDYDMKYVYIDVLVERGFSEWYTVLCPEQVTKELTSEILYAFGLLDSDSNPVLDSQAKKLLFQFQKNHGLPIGNLDFETLELLGIEIK